MHPRLRLVRRARELVEVVRDLRDVERAPVVDSGPIATPVIAAIGERQHVTTRMMGGCCFDFDLTDARA